MMQQFFRFKKECQDAILLFRCGDFYETYCDDAVVAAKVLGITLTRRNNGASVGDEMAGFPYHAIDTYIPKLIRAGYRVAVCDQLEDPKLAKKIVKRGITEVITPGVAISDSVLNHKENNFLAAVELGKAGCGLALLDISTGEFLVGEGGRAYIEKMLASFQPKEVLYNHSVKSEFMALFGGKYCTYELDEWAFGEQAARQKILRHFGTQTLKGFGIDSFTWGVSAAGAVLQYLELTHHTDIGHISAISRIDEDKYVRLDRFTVRSLELVDPMQEDGVSLLSVIDRTSTPMGGRMLRRWLVFPLKDLAEIRKRHDIVGHFATERGFRDLIAGQLRKVGDLERIVARAAAGRVSPREVVQIGLALGAVAEIKAACEGSPEEAVRKMGGGLHLCTELRERIAAEISPEPPQTLNKGGVIADGYDKELDELRMFSRDGRKYLVDLQEKEAARTGIASLKVGYNNVFGYYLEVRNTYKDNVPPGWVRKQTLAQAERYITDELKAYEEKILGADEKILQIETRLFGELVAHMQGFVRQIQADAAALAKADCLVSMAVAAEQNHYVRPEVADDTVLDISAGRHPVIEGQLPPGESYVPNDVRIDTDKQQIIIITGPNMAGKSALLRQTALIAIMAQAGGFVPADKAHIGIVDKVFTRVGASDNIAVGESTFMVEMTEAANILNNVTPRSLVLFDELGRGTSTYDGISIAWAIVEYLHDQPKARARTLFATHYHELNEMCKTHGRIRNYNVSVKEAGGKVIFLRKLVEGGAEHSFGIHVAEMAGMPKSIVARAGAVLRDLEAGGAQGGAVGKPMGAVGQGKAGVQLSLFQLDDPVLCQVRDEILGLDIDRLTPIEALNKLNGIKKIVG